MVKEVKQNAALERAKEEIQKEQEEKAVALYKDLLRKRDSAKTVLANIDREIADLELKIEHGNY